MWREAKEICKCFLVKCQPLTGTRLAQQSILLLDWKTNRHALTRALSHANEVFISTLQGN